MALSCPPSKPVPRGQTIEPFAHPAGPVPKFLLGNLCVSSSSLPWLGKQSFKGPRSQAGALAVIHKCKRPVIPAWTAGIQSQGCEPRGWQLT